MYYHNTKYNFKLNEGSPGTGAGGIIAASAMPLEQLKGRGFSKYPYLQHRLFDPQLYLSSLDPLRATSGVANLASYPWFGTGEVEPYEKEKHKSLKGYSAALAPARRANWMRSTVTNPEAIFAAARSAVELQIELECEAIILPTPLVENPVPGFQPVASWIDAGLEACEELGVSESVFATLAFCDSVIDMRIATENTLLSTATAQIASRAKLAGAYFVVETRSDDAYSFGSQDVVRALMLMIDDLTRGARKQSILNYAGTFGAVARAIGAGIWSSGYYLSQRRLVGADFYRKKGASAYPHYFSLPLAGDIGVEEDLASTVKARLFSRVVTETGAAIPLHAALIAGRKSASVPAWSYRKSNLTAAAAHYNTCMIEFGEKIEALSPPARIEFVEKWLTEATDLADDLAKAGIIDSRVTELRHQSMWLSAFRDWRETSGK